MSESAAGLYYRAGDEPEPIDLTHLNIEAAMMCLASKVRYLSGKADSPTLSSRTFRFKELDAARKTRGGGFQQTEEPAEHTEHEVVLVLFALTVLESSFGMFSFLNCSLYTKAHKK